MTEMSPSLLGRFSLPPTNEGRLGLAWLPVEGASSGASEFFRLEAAVVDVRGRFCPAVDLGRVADFGGAAFVDFWDFLEGASGCGHSTSCDRSSREAGTHSARHKCESSILSEAKPTIKTFVEFLVMDTRQGSSKFFPFINER